MKFLMLLFSFFIWTLYSQDCDKAYDLYTTENYEAAIPLFKSCLENKDGVERIDISLLIARSFYKLSICDSTINWCNVVLENENLNLDALWLRALCFVIKDDYQEALKDINKLIYTEGQNNNEILFYYQGYIYYKLDKYENAEESLRKSLELEKHSGRTNKLMGVILSVMKRYDEAIPYIQTSLFSDQYLDEKYIQLGICYYHIDDFGSAIFYLNKSLNFIDSTDRVLNNQVSLYLGMSYDKIGEHELAVKELEKVASNKEHFLECYLNLANSYEQINKPKEAIEVYLKVRRISSGLPEVLGRIGLLYLEKFQDTVKAREYFLSTFNTNEKIANPLDYFSKLSLNFLLVEDIENAIKSSDKLIDIYPDRPYVYKHRIFLLRNIEKSDYFDEIIFYHEILQDLYLKKGEKEKASYYFASSAFDYYNKGDFIKSYDLINKAILYGEFAEYFLFRSQIRLYMLEKETIKKSNEWVNINRAKKEIYDDLDIAFISHSQSDEVLKAMFVSAIFLIQFEAITEDEVCRIIMKANEKTRMIPEDFELFFCDGIPPEDVTQLIYNYTFKLGTFYDYFGLENDF